MRPRVLIDGDAPDGFQMGAGVANLERNRVETVTRRTCVPTLLLKCPRGVVDAQVVANAAAHNPKGARLSLGFYLDDADYGIFDTETAVPVTFSWANYAHLDIRAPLFADACRLLTQGGSYTQLRTLAIILVTSPRSPNGDLLPGLPLFDERRSDTPPR